MKFEYLAIDPRCLTFLKAQGIHEPTPVQEKSIPIALEGKDLMSVAQTGTGKTLAFGLPALTRLADSKRKHCQFLVLAPTRELAVQVHDVLKKMGRACGLSSICIYGGVSIERQAQILRKGAAIIVATPGRLQDHMDRGNVHFDDLAILALDEADRMLDMGFLPDIQRIMAKLPEERQTLMFSATFPPSISKLAEDMLNEPERIDIASAAQPADAVTQHVYTVDHRGKQGLILNLLDDLDMGPTLIFLRTKLRTERVSKMLSKEGHKAQAIHGDRSQNQRQRAIDSFRKGKCKILVATDVAARGLDVDGITHVINYDMPFTTEDYVHRIGRTARASAEGDAISFVTPEDGAILGTLENDLGEKIDRVDWEGAVTVHARFSPDGIKGKGSKKGKGRKGGRKNTMRQRGHNGKSSESRQHAEHVTGDGAKRSKRWTRTDQGAVPTPDSKPKGDKNWKRSDKKKPRKQEGKREERPVAAGDEWSTRRPKGDNSGFHKKSKKRSGSKNGGPKGKGGFAGPKRGKRVGPKSRKPAGNRAS